jgi:hypothetical protein
MENQAFSDIENLRYLIDQKTPEQICFFDNPTMALRSWCIQVQFKANEKVGVFTAPPNYFIEVAKEFSLKLEIIARDPSLIKQSDFSTYKALWLSNPNCVDSYFYPKFIYEDLLEYFLSYENLLILSEESTRTYFENSLSNQVGSVEKKLSDPRVSLLSGTFSYSNEKLSWIQSSILKDSKLSLENNYQGPKQHRLFSYTQGRQSDFVQRGVIFQRHKFLRFIDRLRPSLQKKLIELPIWPHHTAINLVLNISNVLNSRNLTLREWMKTFDAELLAQVSPVNECHGISTHLIQINLTQSYRESMKLAQRLNEIFLQSL